MTTPLHRDQAKHFDSHTPFTPSSRTLRAWGFKYPYILKDVVISRVLQDHSPSPGCRVLDVGCGAGIFLDRLAASYETIGYGVDISRASLRRSQWEGAHVHRGTCAEAERLPFQDACFDFVVTLDVLEHVESPEWVLGEMLRVLRPGGAILCYALSQDTQLTLNWFLAKTLDALRVNHWAWAGHAPERLVAPARIAAYLEQQGCRVDLLLPFHAFFTILFDQSVLVLYWLAEHVLPPARLRGAENGAPTLVLRIVSALARALVRPLSIMDEPWVRKGRSNGFLLAGTKSQPRSLVGRER
jgi:2-polyprenyl-6-hydroxyphenyl methylase/3-demethylubiquinone-9 3-methyltransferase